MGVGLYLLHVTLRRRFNANPLNYKEFTGDEGEVFTQMDSMIINSETHENWHLDHYL